MKSLEPELVEGAFSLDSVKGITADEYLYRSTPTVTSILGFWWTMSHQRSQVFPISDRRFFLGITGWDPSVCKSNRLHVDILQFLFIKLGFIL